ncbi:two-component response regulator arr1 [Nicotiana attenuata]|uniref:Two-component response regulator arr1 n=2 Tax=Nicotiana attenuata TaxID=49451 RepID=A0A314L477_NICAT|nr:two-component response regulator arr1 [Nicotiana attenuata]
MSQQEINNQPNEGLVNPMAPYNGMINEVHVMLVDHDQETIYEMVDLLESHKYKVTTVGAAEMAMNMLSKGKERYDVMIINAYSPDLLSTRLLGQAVALDIISIFVCDDNNPFLAKKALDVGAYLYLKKPLQEEMVKYLWQFVLKEKLQREKVKKVLENGENMINIGEDNETGENVGDEQGERSIGNDEEQNNNHEVENSESNGKYKLRKKRGRKSTKKANQGDSHSSGKSVKRKVCTEWTLELHAKFLEAVAQLGEGRCYPKEILELMDVPGLTRMQVASHLQKCRNDNWRAPEERKSSRNSSRQGSSSGSQQRSGHRKFGSMPRIQPNIVTNLQQQQLDQEINQRSPPEFQFPPLNNSNIIAGGESSTQEEQAYRPQLPYVEPQYLSIGSPFNNPNFTQNNAGGFVQQQQQNGPFVGMMGQGQGPIIGGTNYRPGFPINNGPDHNAQNGYNMNVNAAHLGYSGGPMISDMNGNMTMNGLGFAVAAANANFQQQFGQPNMTEPNNSNVSDSEGTDSNDGQNCDQYFDFNDVDYLFQNLGPPTSNLPNEQGTEFGPVYSDDQVKPSVPFPGIANFPDDLA